MFIMSRLNLHCPNCESTLHKDSSGVLSCIACGSRTNDAGETLSSTSEVLEQRGSRYGEFKDGSHLSKTLRDTFFKHHKIFGKSHLTDYQIEAVFMIFHKLSRIANGDPTYDDNWRDIAGYAELVVKELSDD